MLSGNVEVATWRTARSHNGNNKCPPEVVEDYMGHANIRKQKG